MSSVAVAAEPSLLQAFGTALVVAGTALVVSAAACLKAESRNSTHKSY